MRLLTTILLSAMSIPVFCQLKLPRWESSVGIDGLTTCDFKVQGGDSPYFYTLTQVEVAAYSSKYNTQGGMSESFKDVPPGKYMLTVTDRNQQKAEFPIEIKCDFELRAINDTIEVNMPCQGGADGVDIELDPVENDILVVKGSINNYSGAGTNHFVKKTAYQASISSKPTHPRAKIINEGDKFVYHIEGAIVQEEEHLTYNLECYGIKSEGSITILFKMEKPVLKEIGIDRNTAIITAEGGSPDYTYIVNDSLESSLGRVSNLPFGNYSAIAIDANGCQSESKNFFINKAIYPSNFFTPNGDGINDTWTILNIEEYSKYRIRIIDRRGVLLKEYVDEYIPWDGTYKGNPMPSSDYWYIMTSDETDQDFSGHFTLLRGDGE